MAVKYFIFAFSFIFLTNSCNESSYIEESYIQIPDFNFSQTIKFENNLSSYNIFEGAPADLNPSRDYYLIELNSTLFTDFAHKQRLVKIPDGTKISKLENGTLNFPNGTILTKTFFYYHDEVAKENGKRIIETRLLIKENEIWNVATYLWNEEQTDAVLIENGFETNVSWLSKNGALESTIYKVPTVNQCITCHQSNSKIAPIGPTLINMNRNVDRIEQDINQLTYLQSKGIMSEFDVSTIDKIVDYNNSDASLTDRARAYLDVNCAHCHNPNGWDKSARELYDFRYDTPLEKTGFLIKKQKVVNTMMRGEMPFIGTTMLDNSGIELLIEFTNGL